jgi:hypothetical protein
VIDLVRDGLFPEQACDLALKCRLGGGGRKGERGHETRVITFAWGSDMCACREARRDTSRSL